MRRKLGELFIRATDWLAARRAVTYPLMTLLMLVVAALFVFQNYRFVSGKAKLDCFLKSKGACPITPPR